MTPVLQWNLADVWESVAEIMPDRPAQRSGTRLITWGEFDRRANALAGDLLEAGLTKQSKVGAYLYSCPEYLESYVAALKAGNKVSGLVRGGLKEGLVTTSPYGPAVSETARTAAEAVKAKFLQGTFVIFQGPLKDNTGKVVIPPGKAYAQKAIELESMDYLVDGVSGR